MSTTGLIKKLLKGKKPRRTWLSWMWNKQTFIFLFFLALSTTFWIFQSLNETYEQDFDVPLELRNVPDNVVITTDLPKTVRVTLRDKGNILLAYRYANKLSAVVVDFSNFSNGLGHVTIASSELRRQVVSQLFGSTQMTAFKPDNLEFYYNYGQCKRIPIIVQKNIGTGNLYSLSNTILAQDSVTVYATSEVLDTISAAYTKIYTQRNLTDTARVNLDFMKVNGAKFVPSTVGVTFCIDRVVEKTVQVPVQQVNFPASKRLRTFPQTVSVTFQVSMGMYREITKDNFVLVVNYEDLLNNPSKLCHLALKSVPNGVSHVRISPQDVEYLIEEASENESDNE